MGFLGRKKNADGSSSTLSESEIRKKLYGEFSDRSSNVVAGEREPFRVPVSTSRETPSETEAPVDLFSAQKEVLSGVNVAPRRVFSEPKPVDQTTPRPISFRSPERKESPTIPVMPMGDSGARFRVSHAQERKAPSFQDLVQSISGKASDFFSYVMDPEQVALRRMFFWGGAILVVFLLFWGVNALNSQREDAMRARYKMPGSNSSEQAPKMVVPEKNAAVPSVSVTPIAAKPKTPQAPVVRAASAAPTSATYVVQVVTYAAKEDAEQVLKTFRRAGLRAFVKEDTRPSGRLFYQVLLGGFKTEAEAKAYLVKFQSKEAARPFQNAYVRLNRS